ncbi:hypothetical protein TNCV_1655561 [Trichonephila clavipes]|nr:hypothetical protein TNCV_1655561 [Trichonephila clavipes]
MVKSTNNNSSVSHDLPAADLLTKKTLNLEEVHKIKSFSLSTTRQLETIKNSTSTPASTVKTSVVLLASEVKAAVNDSKACCVLSAEWNLLEHIRVPFVKIRCTQYVKCSRRRRIWIENLMLFMPKKKKTLNIKERKCCKTHTHAPEKICRKNERSFFEEI